MDLFSVRIRTPSERMYRSLCQSDRFYVVHSGRWGSTGAKFWRDLTSRAHLMTKISITLVGTHFEVTRMILSRIPSVHPMMAVVALFQTHVPYLVLRAPEHSYRNAQIFLESTIDANGGIVAVVKSCSNSLGKFATNWH